MDQIEQMTRVARVREMLNYMASEVVFNMKKIILTATGTENKYAIKYDVRENFVVEFVLFNTETNTKVQKQYDIHDFTRICSNVLTLEHIFNHLTYDMLEAAEKTNQVETIYL